MDNCKICGQKIECYVRKYSTRAFIDGKQYEFICHTCSSVPKTFEYDEINDNIITYYNLSPYYLNDTKDLMDMGWSKIEAITSIKAVQKRLHLSDISLDKLVLKTLVLADVVEVIEVEGVCKLRY
jgi:hypothetical protein